MSRALNLIPHLDRLAKEFRILTIVETGTIRNTATPYILGDGHSTLHIAKWAKKHHFYSIDLHTAVCKVFLANRGLSDRVNLIEGNSLDVLPTFDIIHLAYLDSANDQDLILAEFKIVETRIPIGGICVIDDVDPTNHELQKGLKVLKYIDGNYEYVIANRQLTIWF